MLTKSPESSSKNSADAHGWQRAGLQVFSASARMLAPPLTRERCRGRVLPGRTHRARFRAVIRGRGSRWKRMVAPRK